MRSNSLKKSTSGEMVFGLLERAERAVRIGARLGMEAIPAPWSIKLEEGVRSRTVTL